jgi:hypothetical protein
VTEFTRQHNTVVRLDGVPSKLTHGARF